MDQAVVAENLWEGYTLKSRRGWRRRGNIRWALKDVSFTVGPGEALGIVGHNGSGKSTLLQCVAGVLEPSQGSILAEGRVSSLVDLGAGFNRELSGRENVFIAGVLTGLSRRESKAIYPRIQEFSGLTTEEMMSPIRTYSAGMALRMAFALAVESDPKILLVDEVLAVGDDHFQERCLHRIRSLREEGCAILIVSHHLDVIRQNCRRAIVLSEGHLKFDGDSDEALDFYVHSFEELPQQEMHHGAIYGRGGSRKRRYYRH